VSQHNLGAEQSVLGGVMLDATAFDRVAGALTEDDFTRREHKLIWNAMEQLASQGQPLDLITLDGWLTKQGASELAGGIAYLGLLANNTPSAANIEAYARMVRDASVERQLMSASTAIAEIVKGDGETREKLDRAQTAIMAIADNSASGPLTAAQIMPAVIDEIDRRFQSGDAMLGLASGYDDLDALTRGWQPGDMILIAGRPSSGKSTLAMNIAEHVALKLQQAALVFSLEMSKESLMLRSIASTARLEHDAVRSGKLNDEDWPRMTVAVKALAESKLLIDETPALSVLEIRSRARKVKREHGLSLIVVDYLQLMRGSGENRNLELTHISAGLKAIAKELSVPVIALSQLNRGVEQRQDKRPVMSDLRESGALEQDADVIAFVYRDEMYNENSPAKGTAEIIIRKQRNGAPGTVRLAFLGRLCRFDSYVGAPIEQQAPTRRYQGGFDPEDV